MASVTRLVTFVDVDDDVADARRLSVSARHEAVLVNGRRVLLLDDRGWSASGPPNIWAVTSVEDIADTARMVVGPDEPFGERSHQDMEADHWAHLTEVLRQQGDSCGRPGAEAATARRRAQRAAARARRP